MWSVQGQHGGLLGRQSAGGNLREMLITLSPALQLFLGVSDCEWLSHCGALYHSPGAATGTKGGSSCRFKKDVFSTVCEAAVRIISLPPPIYSVIEKASPNVLSWAVLPINTALPARGKRGVAAVNSASVPLPIPKSGFILPASASFMWDSRNKNTLLVQEFGVQMFRVPCRITAMWSVKSAFVYVTAEQQLF